MRLHFQERPVDLYATVGYTVVIAVGLLVFGVDDLAAIVFILFTPGYVLVAALFPRSPTAEEPGIDWMERLALTFGLGIAVVPLLGLLLDFTPFKVRFGSVVIAIALFTILAGAAAWWQRMRLPSRDRLSATVNLHIHSGKEHGRLGIFATVALAASIIIAAGALIYVVVMPNPEGQFTEFYILGPGGNASGYPTSLVVNETGSLVLGVVNHEAATATYTIRTDLVGVRVVYNTTTGFNETVEANRTTETWTNLTLADGGHWTEPYSFSIPKEGLWEMQFFLYKDGDFSSAYRELRLLVVVS